LAQQPPASQSAAVPLDSFGRQRRDTDAPVYLQPPDVTFHRTAIAANALQSHAASSVDAARVQPVRVNASMHANANMAPSMYAKKKSAKAAGNYINQRWR
jgi:hypothetical protein